MKLNQVSVPSTNIDRSIVFYKKLGLELIVHTHDKYARFLCPNGMSTFSLHWVKESNASSIKIYFEREDLDNYVGLLKAQGIQFKSDPADEAWLWREAHLADPDGNHIVLYYAGENRVNPPWRL
ncbi:MAG: VOC family protein [Bacteroidota bacterium]